MTIEALYQRYRQYPSVQTDTRILKKDDLFFALKGPSFNGNAFAQQALDKGAAYVIIDDASYYIDERTIVVADVLKTLQELAHHHRKQFNIPFIAITGSNGKTTSKELVSKVLRKKYKTYTTKGNLNNHIGIPLTILSVGLDAEMAVIEMGANHQKEIEGYCRYTAPTHGLITNCGKAHLEGFGGVEGVQKGKGELFDYLRAHQGTAFVWKDQEVLQKMSHDIPVTVTYGTSNAQIQGAVITNEPFLTFEFKHDNLQKTVHSNLIGAYNLPNMLAAVAVGTHFQVSDEAIIEAIEEYIPSNSRSQLMQKGSNTIILDAYNANPSSMRLAIENFAQKESGNKVLLLGAMAELGETSLQEHREIIQLIQQHAWKDVVLVGGDFMTLEHPYIVKENADQAKDWLQQQGFSNTQFLIKGSRSQRMEKVLEAF